MWEYRSVVVVGQKLSYYEIGTEDSETARGTIDLWADQASFQIGVPDKAEGAPTPHQIIIRATKVQQGEQVVVDASTNTDSVESRTTGTTNVEWKLCFDQQEDLMRLVSVINRILDQGGAFKQKDVDRFEHEFVKGDHIYRWEMIVCPPVIYPIQIHAIVLEAGRNCLVVADFGLTGYAKKKDAHFHHAEDNDEAMQEQILAAFRKLRPTDSTQRLNIVTLTDQREIRKWFKAGYDEESMLAKAKAASGHHHIPLDKIGKNVGKIFKRNRLHSQDNGKSKRRDSDGSSPSKELRLYRTDLEEERDAKNADDHPPFVPLEEMADWPEEPNSDLQDSGSFHTASSTHEGDDETLQSTEEDKAAKQSARQLEELPHSDPVEIVLARANFCLENMNLLPPYHVFFSNSECIAVWCKTGRWSTLQTAVWCSTNSVGAFKTSTLTTIGVAAANPLLAPVIAIGGLLWVSAPMLILQQSRLAWEEYTRTMTSLFWDLAPNGVFVSAVENWTTILKLETEKDTNTTAKTSPAKKKMNSISKKDVCSPSSTSSKQNESMQLMISVTKGKQSFETEDEKKAPDNDSDNEIETNLENTPKSATSEEAIESRVSENEALAKSLSLSDRPSTNTIDDNSNNGPICDTEQPRDTADKSGNDNASKPKTFRILNAGRNMPQPEEASEIASDGS
jgi:hypothetical protein